MTYKSGRDGRKYARAGQWAPGTPASGGFTPAAGVRFAGNDDPLACPPHAACASTDEEGRTFAALSSRMARSKPAAKPAARKSRSSGTASKRSRRAGRRRGGRRGASRGMGLKRSQSGDIPVPVAGCGPGMHVCGTSLPGQPPICCGGSGPPTLSDIYNRSDRGDDDWPIPSNP
jgi:hypothetical protein